MHFAFKNRRTTVRLSGGFRPTCGCREVLYPLAMLAAVAAHAQQIPFQLLFTQGGNAATIQNGAALNLNTPIGQTQTGSLVATFTGSGQTVIAAAPSVLGSTAFTATISGALPVTLNPGDSVTINFQFAPTSATQSSAIISMGFTQSVPAAGTSPPTVTTGTISLTMNLQGIGSAAFIYQVLSNPPVTVKPGGTITLPGANVGQTSSVTVQVSNSGNASGSVSAISVTGQGFQVAVVPPLPQTLAPNASLTLTLTFAPAQPGVLAGTLFVNSDMLNLSGTGLGPQLQFSYTTGGTTVTLNSTNNSVIFSPVTITQSAQLSLNVKNVGTLSATLSNIGVGQNGSPFSLTGLPSLPASLDPGVGFQITITFKPVSLGFSNGTLVLDNTSIALVGSGTQPPPLPSYTISGPSGTASPASQPSIGLTLASPYPAAIAGTLILSIAGSLPTDPSVQFATGGQTIAFTIPANSTNAIFGTQGPQIGLQTGTVAGTITLTPAFATQAGNVDLTPSSPQALQFSVVPAAPTLAAIELANETATGFTIQVTGFSTTRALKSWSVQFTTAPGYKMPVSQFTIDVQSIAALWFRSTASQTFGSQFTLSVPFTLQGSSGQNLLPSLESLSVTMSNDVGASASLAATVQ